MRGLSLSERLQLDDRVNIPGHRCINDHVRQTITHCRSWFQSENARQDEWSTFLSQLGVDEEELVKLANTTHRVTAYFPSWATVAGELMSFLSNRRFAVRPHLSIAGNIAVPVTKFAQQQLWSSISTQQRRLLRGAVKRGLEDSLTRQLAWSAAKIITFELKKFPRLGQNVTTERDATNRARRFFVGGVARETEQLLSNYPALLRLWSRQVENWHAFLRDFLAHVEGFLAAEYGAYPCSESVIERIQPLLSDPHNGNRSVIAVQFCGGKTWYYKPRTGTHEHGWFRLLAWLNDQGFPAPFQIVKVICNDEHSWMEGVEACSVSSNRAAAKYYFRAGALLYLLHVLRGTDCHAANLIASAAQPVMIDCETLLHARTPVPSAARRSMRDILRTGMLPLKRGGSADDASSLGRFKKGAHLLRKDGKAVLAARHVHSIEAGFLGMHRLLHRSARMRSAFDRKVHQLLPQTGRRIYRPTSFYVEMLNRSNHAGTMVDGLRRSLFLHALCRDGATPASCVPDEVAALEDGDIPIFCGPTATPRPRSTQTQLRRSLSILREQLQ